MYTHIIMHPLYSHPAGVSNTNQTHFFLLGREEDMRYWTQVAYRTQIPCFQIRSLLYRLYGNVIGNGTGRGGGGAGGHIPPQNWQRQACCSGVHDLSIKRQHGLVKSTLGSKWTQDEQVSLLSLESDSDNISEVSEDEWDGMLTLGLNWRSKPSSAVWTSPL